MLNYINKIAFFFTQATDQNVMDQQSDHLKYTKSTVSVDFDFDQTSSLIERIDDQSPFLDLVTNMTAYEEHRDGVDSTIDSLQDIGCFYCSKSSQFFSVDFDIELKQQYLSEHKCVDVCQ